MSDTTRTPWDLDPSLDTPATFPYFLAYLYARKGTRKLDIIRKSVWDRGANDPPPLHLITSWYVKGKWQERAMHYDAHAAKVYQEEREILERQTAEEDALRLRNILNLQTAVVEQEWEKAVMRSSKEELEEVSIPRGLVAATDSALKNRRLINGQSTEKIETFSALTDEELDLYIELERKKTGK